LALLEAKDRDKLYEVLARYGMDVHESLAQAALQVRSDDTKRAR